MYRAILLAGAAALALTACNVELGKKENKEHFGYDITENGCPTGKHSFGSKSDYCSALKNDVLNNNCAWSTRKGFYERDCGSDWALYYNN